MSRTPTSRSDTGFSFPFANEEILAHFPNGVVPNPLPDDIYAPYAGKIQAGRPFRQPVQTAADAADFSAGLELFFTDDQLASSAYAWLSGTLRWAPAQTTGDASTGGLAMRASLRLDTDITSLSALAAKPGGIETPPATAIYENMDAADVTTALTTVLTTAYNQSATLAKKDWHPILTGQVSKKKTVKQSIDDAVTAGNKKGQDAATSIAGAVSAILTAFTGAANTAVSLQVQEGDLLGHAGTSGNADPAKARQIVFYTLDKGRQFINPIYYLQRYSTATKGITNFTLIGPQQPLIALFPDISGTTPPPARIPIVDADGNSQILLPVGHLGLDHSFGKSKIQWKYAPATVSSGTDNGDVKFDTTPHQTLTDVAAGDSRVTALPPIWTKYGDDISQICGKLGIPCEIAVAIMGHETSWADQPNSYRIEPLTNAQRATVRAQLPDLELKYDYAVGILSATTPATTVSLDSAGTSYGGQVSSTMGLTLAALRTLKANQLVNKTHQFVLVSDAYRPKVIANTATSKNNLAMTIGVVDERFASRVTVQPASTVYYALVDSDSGAVDTDTSNDRASVAAPLARPGTLRVLRARASQTGAPGGPLPYDVSIGIFTDDKATALKVTIPSGSSNGSEISQTVAVTSENISVQVITAGAAGGATVALEIECFLAPASGATVVVADGTSNGISDAADIPDPWDPDAVVRNNRNGKSITWGELADVLDALGGQTMSPGFMQTLIGTARDMANFVSNNAPDILTDLGIPPAPTASGDFIRSHPGVDANGQPTGSDVPGWLLVPRQSFFAGIARLRWGYNGHLAGLDLPLICSNYNSGGRTGGSFRYGVNVNFDGDKASGRPGYVDDTAARLGIAVDLFAALSPGDTVPSIRLKR